MIRIVDLCGADHTLESPEPLLFEKNQAEAECFKYSIFVQEALKDKINHFKMIRIVDLNGADQTLESPEP